MKQLKRLKFTAPFFDGSGYGKASRQNAIALHKVGIELSLNPVSFEHVKPDIGKYSDLLHSLVNINIEADAHLIQLTPEHFSNYIKNGEKTVGYTVWENDRLFPSWPGFINALDKVITGSSWGKEVFIKSGVDIPVGVCSHCIDEVGDINNAYNISGLDSGTFVFGDIMQWVEKKSPLDLIKTYWATFTENDNVALVLKTYRSDFSSAEKDAIRQTIKRLKQVTPLDYYPPIYLILDLLTDDEIRALHTRFDCYTSFDKGEGVGIGPLTAGAFGTPIIITGWGGSTEYAKKDNSYLVDYSLEPCFGMPYCPWIRGDQWWAKADLKQASEYMRHVYDNRTESKSRGRRLQKYLRKSFSYEAIGEKLVNEIREIL